MSKCAACGRFVAEKDGAKCTKCGSLFEKICVHMSKFAKTPANWTCPGCVSKQPRKDNSETPVKAASPASPSSEKGDTTVQDSCCGDSSGEVSTAQELMLIRQDLAGMCSKIDQFTDRMDSMMAVMKGVVDRLTAVEGNILAVEERLDMMEARVCALEERDGNGNSASSGAITELVDTIERLKVELNDRDQDLLSTDIEITMLPEIKGENPLHLVKLVADKLGVQLEERDVMLAERVGAPRAVGEDGAPTGVPRPLAVRLARRDLRDKMLREARVRRTVDTSGFNLPGPARRFYVNERLTRENRRLFGKARQEAKSRGWRFVWTRSGRIYARRLKDTQAHRIGTESDIVKIFGIA